MKKTAIGLCLLLVLTGWIFPQNKKGTWLVGVDVGSAGYSFYHSENGSSSYPTVSYYDQKSYSFVVYPTIGYYLKDNLALGAYLSLGYYSGKSDSSSSTSTSSSVSKYSEPYFSIGPFVRYYLGKEGGAGQPYIHAYVQATFYPGYSGEYIPSTGTGYTYKYKNYVPIYAGIQIGYEHYLLPTIGLQYYVGYTFSTFSYDIEYDYPTGTEPGYNYSGYSHGISFGVGLQIHLIPEKK